MTARAALPPNPPRAPERALAAKTRLDEYEFERVLAQSSFAVVYRAYDHVLKLHVAIKEYLPDALALRGAETQVVLRARLHAERFEKGLQAFITEAQTLARCEHPSLLRITRILLRHGTAYRVMRYSPGPTLLEARRELGAAPDAQALRAWLDALLGALEALHEDGCVHAAVAPGNILLRPGGKPLLLDFDAVPAALISDRTQSMMAALEPCFEPLEQREPAPDSPLGPWTDLYALAATLHFCIGAQLPPPPQGASTASRFEPLPALWQRLRRDQPAMADAPPWLEVLDACLSEDASRRPQSVAEMRERLEAVAVPEAAGARSAPKRAAALPVPDSDVEQMPLPASVQDPAAASAHSSAALAPAGTAAPAPGTATLGPAAFSAADVVGALPRAEAEMPAMLQAAPPSQGPAVVMAATRPPDPAAPSDPPFEPAPPGKAPPRPASAPDATHAKVMADLDKTFAFIAAQANEEAPPIAAPVPPPTPGADAAATMGLRQWIGVLAVALLFLSGLAATVVWLYRESLPGLGTAALTPGVPSVQGPGALPPPAAPANPLPGSTGGTANAADKAAGKAPPKAAQPPPDAPKAQARPTQAPVATSPRDICGERKRFALFECMQQQCAKKAWAQHPQCVRLRKEQKLG